MTTDIECFVRYPNPQRDELTEFLSKVRLSDWMNDLHEQLEDLPINQLIVPGAEQAAVSKLDFTASVPQNGIMLKTVRKMALYIPCVRHMVEDWMLKQSKSVTGLLESGVRFLDLRLMRDPSNLGYYFSSTYVCQPAFDLLQDVSTFLEKHKGEVVYIAVKADDVNKGTLDYLNNNNFLSGVKERFGTKLCPVTKEGVFDVKETALKELVKKDQRIVFFFGCEYQKTAENKNWDFIWDYNNIVTHASTRKELQSLVSEFAQNIKKFMLPDGISKEVNVVECVAKPGKFDLVSDAAKRVFTFGNCHRGQSFYSERVNSLLPEVVANNRDALRDHGVSVVSLSDPNEKVIRSIIGQNLFEKKET